MRRYIVLAVAVLLAGGCARADAVTVTGTRAPETPPTNAVDLPASAPVGDRAAIHIAVLKRYLTSGDSAYGGQIKNVYVLDRTDPKAADPMEHDSAKAPIPAADKAAIQAALPQVRFVSDRKQVVTSVDRCEQVTDGILITLAPPKPTGPGTAEVGINGFYACLGATWLTYVVARGTDSTWSVTGTTGSMAIA